jgi:steroid 5-alpha reductase family enzyme
MFMPAFAILVLAALVISTAGFYKYVYFISLGYGFSVAVIGLVLLALFREKLAVAAAVLCVLLIVYGCRLGGYLLLREIRSASYRSTMKREIKSGDGMKLTAKLAIWLSCAVLYACQTSPVLFRLESGAGTDGFGIAGIIVMICGLALESASDLQKSAAKKRNPRRFVDTGLFRLVRCPNYLGEVLIWTGVFVSGVNCLHGVWQWLAALTGYLCIVYIMFGGARRLELRQNRNYGDDPEYQQYVKSTPILIPFVPLYSVAKYKWLVG